MEEIQDLKRKVNHLEYEEIKQIKEDVANIKIDIAKNNILTQQSIDMSNRLTDTMEAVKSAMYEITDSVKNSNRISVELTENVKDLNSQFNEMRSGFSEKFEEVDKKISQQDNKTKIDWVACFTNGGWTKFIEIFLLIGIMAYVTFGKVGLF